MVRKAHGQEGEFPRLHLLFITDVPSRRPRRMVWGLTLRVDVVSGFRGTLNRGFFIGLRVSEGVLVSGHACLATYDFVFCNPLTRQETYAETQDKGHDVLHRDHGVHIRSIRLHARNIICPRLRHHTFIGLLERGGRFIVVGNDAVHCTLPDRNLVVASISN